MESPEDLAGWISIAEAARRLPSPRPGKQTHKTTIYRLIKKHGLPVKRRGPWRFVRWTDLVDLFDTEGERIDRRRIEAPRTSRWAREVLERLGIEVPQ